MEESNPFGLINFPPADEDCPECAGTGEIEVLYEGRRFAELCECIYKKMEKGK